MGQFLKIRYRSHRLWDIDHVLLTFCREDWVWLSHGNSSFSPGVPSYLRCCGPARRLAGYLQDSDGWLWQHLGAWTQLVTGVLLVGVAEMIAGDGGSGINHLKIGAKLVLLLAIIVSAVLGRRATKRGNDVPVGLAHSVGGLTLVNISLAVFW